MENKGNCHTCKHCFVDDYDEHSCVKQDMSPIYNLNLACPYYTRDWFKVIKKFFKDLCFR